MAESSRFWDGITGGDGAEAPYDSSEMAEILAALGAAEPITTHKSGVFRDVDNELGATVGANKVTIGTGKALVSGRYYKNTTDLDVTIPDATSGRRDRIVLKRDTSAQTVRIVRIAGVDNGSGTAPTIPTGDASTWYMPLWIVNKAAGVAAAVTLITDERSYIPHHGDQSAEGGTRHAASQITGLPAFGATPTTVTPGTASAVGATGTYAGGQHIHAITPPPFAYKTGNTTHSNVTSLVGQEDDHLILPVLANKIYVVQMLLLAYNNVDEPGFQFDITLPSGNINSIGTISQNPSNLEPPVSRAMFGTSGIPVIVSLAGGIMGVILVHAVVSIAGSAGNVRVRWAQNVASVANGTILAAGSYILGTLVN